jgi:hypothetical protein
MISNAFLATIAVLLRLLAHGSAEVHGPIQERPRSQLRNHDSDCHDGPVPQTPRHQGALHQSIRASSAGRDAENASELIARAGDPPRNERLERMLVTVAVDVHVPQAGIRNLSLPSTTRTCF